MIIGFDRAVGPLQPSEQPEMVPYVCQTGMGEEPPTCVFELYDAGTGRTVARCVQHGHAVLAVDWTAPHFGGTMTLAEALDAIRGAFTALREEGIEIDDSVPNMQQQRFGEVFASIAQNITRAAEQIARDNRDRANEVVERDR